MGDQISEVNSAHNLIRSEVVRRFTRSYAPSLHSSYIICLDRFSINPIL